MMSGLSESSSPGSLLGWLVAQDGREKAADLYSDRTCIQEIEPWAIIPAQAALR